MASFNYAVMATSSESKWSKSSLRSSLPSLSSSPSSSSSSSPISIRFPLSSPSSKTLRISHTKPISLLQSFTGLAPLNPLFLSTPSSSEFTGFDHCFTIIDNGGRVYAMRHGRKTTRARASAIRKWVDKMITLAKDGSLHKRRQALGFIYEKQIVHALFAEVPERYGERNGGYTRIIRTLPRRGDNAPMAYIELV
ncbi:hypothetical protein TanjilG_01472 [Lupinus angustifolius]|uniref:50S ribosomal protein L17 n=1 Tax=Lupinus angustifolius TaxID=3871 RepID=A0A4P1QVD0_LUPAN|nr:hypothetical protein TanjilG_01472 [Lupinus angustifolius]